MDKNTPELATPNTELDTLKAELAKKDSELKSLYAELQKTKERERDLEETRKAMLYMLEDLCESEERYRLVTELTSDFIFKSIVSPGGQMVLESITQRFTDITGYSPDDIKTADSWQRIAHADDRQVLDGFFKAILKG